jgi:aminoglycoside 3-N-acetyltransferase
MISYRELVNACRLLGLVPGTPVIAHTAFSSFGDEVRGGPEALVGALLIASGGVMAPTFTYKTMVTPETGPENNACIYGSERDLNRMAEFFSAEMPADRLMGLLPETLRRLPGAKRSSHPIFSFAAMGLDEALETQTLTDPLAPLNWLMKHNGVVLLIGVDQRVNTSIHLAEALAGRKQFLRWALTSEGVLACPGFPGCSEGFNQLQPVLEPFTRRAQVGEAVIQSLSIRELVEQVIRTLREDPLAFLCQRSGCERCDAVRTAVNTGCSVLKSDCLLPPAG